MDYLGLPLITDHSYHYPEWSDFKPIFILMVFFLGLEYICTKLFFKLGDYLLKRNMGEKFHSENPERVVNFSKRGYFFLTHLLLTFSAWILFRNESWWYFNSYRLGLDMGKKKFGWAMRFYMNYNAADYVYKTLVILVKSWFWKKPKDFNEMIYHHVLSFVMIFYSYMTSHSDFAVMFLYISNQTDCFTYSARMCNDSKSKYPSYVMLPAMMIAWIYNRLIFNPSFLVPSGYQMMKYFTFDSASPCDVHVPILINLTLGLYLLHVHWIYGLLRVTYNTITRGVKGNVDEMAYDFEKKKKAEVELEEGKKSEKEELEEGLEEVEVVVISEDDLDHDDLEFDVNSPNGDEEGKHESHEDI